MAQSIADFFVDIGVKGDGALTLKSMVSSMADMKLETLGEIGALSVLAAALQQTAKQAMEMSIGFTAMRENFGIDPEMVQRWQNVARSISSVTVTTAGMKQSFENMASLLAGPFAGDPSSKFFQAAGRLGMGNIQGLTAEQAEAKLMLRVPQFMNRMIEEFSKTMSPESADQRARALTDRLLKDLGQAEGMRTFFMLSPQQRRRGELSSGIISNQDIQNWSALSKQVDVLGHNLFIDLARILATALPGLLSFGNSLHHFADGMEDFIAKNFKKAGETASLPWGGGNATQGDIIGHALMSWAIPDIVAANVRASGGKSVTINQDIDLHAHGSDAQSATRDAMRIFQRDQQDVYTRTALLAQSMSGVGP